MNNENMSSGKGLIGTLIISLVNNTLRTSVFPDLLKEAQVTPLGQRRLTHVPIGLCTKFGELHPELRIFLNFSWVIVIYHFVGCSNVYLKIIVKYEIDHHIRDPLTRDLDFPIFILIDFKF